MYKEHFCASASELRTDKWKQNESWCRLSTQWECLNWLIRLSTRWERKYITDHDKHEFEAEYCSLVLFGIRTLTIWTHSIYNTQHSTRTFIFPREENWRTGKGENWTQQTKSTQWFSQASNLWTQTCNPPIFPLRKEFIYLPYYP